MGKDKTWALLLFLAFRISVVMADVKDDTERISKLLTNRPAQERFVIEFTTHKVFGPLEPRWYIKGTMFWVDLYPELRFPMKELQKSHAYEVNGFVVGQDYGTVHIWTESLKKVE